MNKLLLKKNLLRIICAAIPVIVTMLVVLSTGHHLKDVYLPNGDWNDEMIYYQMVNSHLDSDITGGYFGYNESQAPIGNFGAWSPARIVLWFLFGKVFGWSYNSQWIANLVFMSLAFLIYSVLTEVSLKDEIKMLAFFLTYFWFTKATLSGMSEASVWVILIIFFGYTKRWYVNEDVRTKDLVIGFLLITLLFVLRPYFAFLLIMFFDVLRKRIDFKKWLAMIVATIAVYAVLYILFNSLMVAPLFTGNLVETSFVDVFKTEGIIAGVLNLFAVAFDMIKTLFILIFQSITRSFLNITCCMALSTVLLLIESIILYRRKNAAKYRRLIIMWDCFIIVLIGASFYLFDIVYAIRHWSCFVIIMGILIAGIDDKASSIITAVNVVIFLYIFAGISTGDNGGIPIYTEEKELALNDFTSAMGTDSLTDSPWDNTIDWVITDIVDGQEKSTDYTLLFGAPRGYAINACKAKYISEQFDEVKARYIYTVNGGEAADFLADQGAEVVYSNDNVVLYKTR